MGVGWPLTSLLAPSAAASPSPLHMDLSGSALALMGVVKVEEAAGAGAGPRSKAEGLPRSDEHRNIGEQKLCCGGAGAAASSCPSTMVIKPLGTHGALPLPPCRFGGGRIAFSLLKLQSSIKNYAETKEKMRNRLSIILRP